MQRQFIEISIPLHPVPRGALNNFVAGLTLFIDGNVDLAGGIIGIALEVPGIHAVLGKLPNRALGKLVLAQARDDGRAAAMNLAQLMGAEGTI